jgi:membrane-associated phospholipid phosphatase
VDFYYWLDLPYNCFPSLHVSNVFLVSFFMQRFKKGMGWILFPLSTLVAVSVVLVKQHYIADVVAGIFVGWFVYRQVFNPGINSGVGVREGSYAMQPPN